MRLAPVDPEHVLTASLSIRLWTSRSASTNVAEYTAAILDKFSEPFLSVRAFRHSLPSRFCCPANAGHGVGRRRCGPRCDVALAGHATLVLAPKPVASPRGADQQDAPIPIGHCRQQNVRVGFLPHLRRLVHDDNVKRFAAQRNVVVCTVHRQPPPAREFDHAFGPINPNALAGWPHHRFGKPPRSSGIFVRRHHPCHRRSIVGTGQRVDASHIGFAKPAASADDLSRRLALQDQVLIVAQWRQ